MQGVSPRDRSRPLVYRRSVASVSAFGAPTGAQSYCPGVEVRCKLGCSTVCAVGPAIYWEGTRFCLQLLGRAVKLNAIAEGFDPASESASELGTIAAVEVVGTEIVIRNVVAQDVGGSGEDRSGDGYHGFLGSAPSLEA